MGKLSRKQKRSTTLSVELGDAMVASPLIRAAWAAAIEAGAQAAAAVLRSADVSPSAGPAEAVTANAAPAEVAPPEAAPAKPAKKRRKTEAEAA